MALDLTNPFVVGESTRRSSVVQLLNNDVALSDGETRITGGATGKTLRFSSATQLEAVFPTDNFRQRHLGLWMSSHPDYVDRQSKIVIRALAQVTFDDGYLLVPSPSSFPLTIDITASGANGRDQGSEESSTWYDILLARKASDGTLAGLLHKSNRLVHTEQTTSDGTLALGDAAARTRNAQSFQVASTGTLRALLLKFAKVGTPAGGDIQFWVTIEADSSGSPSGTALATSQKWLATDVNATARAIPFTFAQTVTLTASTTYWIVVRFDFTISASHHLTLSTNTAGGYASGSVKSFNGSSWSDVSTIDLTFCVVTETDDAAIALPSGYTHSCRLGRVYNDGSGHFQPFRTIGEVTYNTFSETAVAGKLTAVTDTAEIGNVVYDGTQIPPVAFCLVDGPAFNQGAATARLTMGVLDSGIAITGGHGFVRSHTKTNESASDGETQFWTGVPFVYQMAQLYKNAINNQSFTPKAWRVIE